MIRLTTLGSIDLRTDRRDSSLLEHPKRFAVLVYLAAFPGQKHQRDALLATFWPEADNGHARNALRQSLHVIRRSLGRDVLISHGGGMLSVDERLVASDADRFCRLIEDGYPAKAIELYRGDFMAGFGIEDAPDFERWCDGHQNRMRHLARGAIWSLTAGREITDLAHAIGHARLGVALFPHDESVARRLISLLVRQDNLADALDQYERLRHRLNRDLGIGPSTKTRQIAEGVRLGTSLRAGASRASTRTPRPAGT